MGKEPSEMTLLLKVLLLHVRSLPLPPPPIWELRGTSPARGDLSSEQAKPTLSLGAVNTQSQRGWISATVTIPRAAPSG